MASGHRVRQDAERLAVGGLSPRPHWAPWAFVTRRVIAPEEVCRAEATLSWQNRRFAFCAEHGVSNGRVGAAHGASATELSESKGVNIGGRIQSVREGSGAISRS